jgi:DNA-binding transcriptional MerR regulator
MAKILTLGNVAKQLGVPIWAIRRLYERGILPEPARVALYRVVSADDLPAIEVALRRAGYLSGEVANVS